MHYFLAKTEPDSYSVDQFEADGSTTWDGVKNPQALRAIREMKTGDRVFIYHSGGKSEIAGIAKVASAPQPDPKDEKLTVVNLSFWKRVEPPVTLKDIKATHLFDDWALVRQSRLSTMAAPDSFAKWVGELRPQLKL